MAALVPSDLVSLNKDEHGQKQTQVKVSDDNSYIDCSQRAQWLCAAVMGATDGLVSVASLMMGVGAVRADAKPMLLAGFAGSVAGACSMAIGEFVSVYTQYEVEVGQMRRDMNMTGVEVVEIMMEKRTLPNPLQAAFVSASASSYSLGALAPLLAAGFINDCHTSLMVVVAVASLALLVFGWVGSVLGMTPKMRSCVRVLVGGWMAMAITFGLTKLLGSSGLEL